MIIFGVALTLYFCLIAGNATYCLWKARPEAFVNDWFEFTKHRFIKVDGFQHYYFIPGWSNRPLTKRYKYEITLKKSKKKIFIWW